MELKIVNVKADDVAATEATFAKKAPAATEVSKAADLIAKAVDASVAKGNGGIKIDLAGVQGAFGGEGARPGPGIAGVLGRRGYKVVRHGDTTTVTVRPLTADEVEAKDAAKARAKANKTVAVDAAE